MPPIATPTPGISKPIPSTNPPDPGPDPGLLARLLARFGLARLGSARLPAQPGQGSWLNSARLEPQLPATPNSLRMMT